jgi:hypothetical protein
MGGNGQASHSGNGGFTGGDADDSTYSTIPGYADGMARSTISNGDTYSRSHHAVGKMVSGMASGGDEIKRLDSTFQARISRGVCDE